MSEERAVFVCAAATPPKYVGNVQSPMRLCRREADVVQGVMWLK
jgi:hypothetical protein